ncbi:T9SS type A sorting domain-containing protein [Botryobacter ruber]|uniref:T9SS type A sorting domain-containing protein n=1 Tax=Botryobacter ruber TaxID=2171629 RepID=UPI000E0A8D3A|nr:T9SS type A sorting domain-containing protein [Botryobacter ruber]
MKKFYTLAAAAVLTCSTFNFAFAQAKKVLYITQDKGTGWDATAAPQNNDAVIQLLKRDSNFDVTVRVLTSDEANAAATAVDMAPYDVVVIQESLGSSSAILSPTGTLGLSRFTKPTLYNKPYSLRAGRALAAGTAGEGIDASMNSTVVDGTQVPGFTVLSMTVPTANRTNELFKGISFTDEAGTLPVFKTGSTDNGGAPTGTQAYKGFSYNNAIVLTPANRTLAEFAGNADRSIAATGTPIFFNDIPANTQIGSETTQARIIMMGMNYGALNKDAGSNLTREGLTLWRNAIYSLAGLTVPTTLANPLVTNLATEKSNALFSLGQNYPNPTNGSTTIQFELKKAGAIALEVFDITGRKVATLAEGNKAAGAHEVRFVNTLNSGVYFYKLSANGVSATRKMVVAN